ncbi:MAG: phosphotransferase [Anaerolineae bacterium]|nr:phosphotransferase [Anaerolineae bacterium]
MVVYTNSGKKVLKLYKKNWQVPAIQFEHSILSRLAQLDFAAPRLVPALHNETFVGIGSQYYAVFDYVDGTVFSSCFMARSQRLKLQALAGKTLAQFHRLLEGYLPQGRHHLGFKSYSDDRWRDLAWHITTISNIVEKSRAWTRPEDQTHLDWLVARKNYLEDSLYQLEESLKDAPLPRLVIHGDYGIHNLQFHRNGKVIVHDFELARLEWRLVDLVIVLSRLSPDRSQSFMTGYLADYALTVEEWDLLPQVWQLYKLQGAIQYWHTFFEIGGRRRLIGARQRINQADWAIKHKAQLLKLKA